MMESSIHIIQLPPSRWQEYKALRLESMQVDPQAFGDTYEEWSAYSDEKWQKRPNDPDKIILMAEDNGRFVGMVGVHIDHIGEDRHEAHVWGMYIRPSHRGKGIGKLLMSELISKLQAIPGLHKIELMVNKEQEVAVKLYSSFGFQITGETTWDLGDNQTHPLHIMERDL